MASRIFYKASVHKDLLRLDKAIARRLLNKIEGELSANPSRGAPLSGEFHGLLKYRVGDYRIIYSKIAEGLLILRIGHSKEVYR